MSAEVHAIYPPEPDLDVAIDFLKLINPDGRQAFRGHNDEGQVAETPKAVFEPGMWDEKKALIRDWSSRRLNVWVLPNEPLPGKDGMKEEDVGFIRAFFSDTDHKGLQKRALDAMNDPTRSSQAACVNDSGAGIHVYWILEKPIAITPEVQAQAERVGRGVMAHMDGDHVWNINRPMRVPGTVNYLSATKRAAGRQIAPTTTLAAGTARVTMERMLQDYPAPVEAAKTKVSDAAYEKALSELDLTGSPPDAGLIAKIGGLWNTGVVNGDATGSGQLWRLAMKCRDEGLSGAEFSRLAMAWQFIGPRQTEQRSMARAWARASKGAQASAAFADDAPTPEPEPPPAEVGDAPLFTMKPYGKLPRREWLYGKRLIRKYLSSTVAAGGTGKSSLEAVEAVAMAIGRDLLGAHLDEDEDGHPHQKLREPLRVLVWNGEDPQVELDLRFHAVMKHFGYAEADLGGRLVVVSGRDYPLRLGHEKFEAADVKWLMRQIGKHKIDVVIIDPFVSSHRVPENDNMAIDMVAKTWSMIAERGRCAVDLVHHIRKPSNGMAVDLTVDDARGASALINASRNARVLSPMGETAAKTYRVNRKAHFAIQHDATKANMVPGMMGVDWFKFVSVDMGNGDPFEAPPIDGDSVGVVERWEPSLPITLDPTIINAVQDEVAKRDYRYDVQGKPWVGEPIAGALGFDPVADRKLVKATLEVWIDNGWFVVVEKEDKKRMPRDFVVVGNRPSTEF